MKAYETCPVCGGLNCGTACTNVGRWLTPAQRQDVEEASPRRQVADLERERDEAQAEVEELESAHERAIREMDRMWTERDAARAQVAALQDALDSIAWLAEDTAKKNLFYVQENRSAAELARGRAYQDMARRIRYALAGTEDET